MVKSPVFLATVASLMMFVGPALAQNSTNTPNSTNVTFDTSGLPKNCETCVQLGTQLEAKDCSNNATCACVGTVPDALQSCLQCGVDEKFLNGKQSNDLITAYSAYCTSLGVNSTIKPVTGKGGPSSGAIAAHSSLLVVTATAGLAIIGAAL